MKPLVLLLAATGLAALAAPVPKEFKQKRPVYFPLAMGDRREYAPPGDPTGLAEVREITAVETKDGAKHFTLTISGGGTMEFRPEKDGRVTMVGQNGRSFEPHLVVGPDVKDGDSWEYTDGTGRTRIVGKPEMVTVPAGTFTALPVTIRYNRPGPADIVSWYADGVGMVRQDTAGQPTLELKAFTPGKEAK